MADFHSQDAIREAEVSDTTPLIPSQSARPYNSSNNNNHNTFIEEDEDPTAVYARVLSEHLPWHKRPSGLWLFPLIALAAINGGMLMSTVGQFRTTLLCRDYLRQHPPSDTTTTVATGFATFLMQPAPECRSPEIQAYTAKTLAVIDVLGAIAATLSIGYYAAMSDKHGRIKILILASFNSLFMLSALFIMGTWWDLVGVPFLAFATLVHGLMGGMNLGSTIALAYTADCTDPKRRSLMFSWLHAGLFIGLAIG
ncbi:hypothetical protein BGZ65_011200, partial [Modicella reniformis]